MRFFSNVKEFVSNWIYTWAENYSSKDFKEIGRSEIPSSEKLMVWLLLGLATVTTIIPNILSALPTWILLFILPTVTIVLPINAVAKSFQFNLKKTTKTFILFLFAGNAVFVLFSLLMLTFNIDVKEILQTPVGELNNLQWFAIYNCFVWCIFIYFSYVIWLALAIVKLPIVYFNFYIKKIVSYVLLRQANMLSGIIGISIITIILYQWILFKEQFAMLKYFI